MKFPMLPMAIPNDPSNAHWDLVLEIQEALRNPSGRSRKVAEIRERLKQSKDAFSQRMLDVLAAGIADDSLEETVLAVRKNVMSAFRESGKNQQVAEDQELAAAAVQLGLPATATRHEIRGEESRRTTAAELGLDPETATWDDINAIRRPKAAAELGLDPETATWADIQDAHWAKRAEAVGLPPDTPVRRILNEEKLRRDQGTA